MYYSLYYIHFINIALLRFLHYVSTPEDLASVLEEVVRLNDEMRPHLLRYQELLRAPSGQVKGCSFLFQLTYSSGIIVERLRLAS